MANELQKPPSMRSTRELKRQLKSLRRRILFELVMHGKAIKWLPLWAEDYAALKPHLGNNMTLDGVKLVCFGRFKNTQLRSEFAQLSEEMDEALNDQLQ